MNSIWCPRPTGLITYRAHLLPSLWVSCRSHSQQLAVKLRNWHAQETLSHEPSAKMWHFTVNSGNKWKKSAPVSRALPSGNKSLKVRQACRTAAVKPKATWRALCNYKFLHTRGCLHLQCPVDRCGHMSVHRRKLCTLRLSYIKWHCQSIWPRAVGFFCLFV